MTYTKRLLRWLFFSITPYFFIVSSNYAVADIAGIYAQVDKLQPYMKNIQQRWNLIVLLSYYNIDTAYYFVDCRDHSDTLYQALYNLENRGNDLESIVSSVIQELQKLKKDQILPQPDIVFNHDENIALSIYSTIDQLLYAAMEYETRNLLPSDRYGNEQTVTPNSPYTLTYLKQAISQNGLSINHIEDNFSQQKNNNCKESLYQTLNTMLCFYKLPANYSREPEISRLKQLTTDILATLKTLKGSVAN